VDTPASGYPPGNLRASDADRDRAVTELAGHFQAGRLTAEELDERSGRALAARTGNELAGLFADLPPDDVAATSTAAGLDRPSRPWPPCGWTARVAPTPLAMGFAIAAAAVILTGFPHGHYHPAALIPVLVVLLVIRRLASTGQRERRLAADVVCRRDQFPSRRESVDVTDDADGSSSAQVRLCDRVRETLVLEQVRDKARVECVSCSDGVYCPPGDLAREILAHVPGAKVRFVAPESGRITDVLGSLTVEVPTRCSDVEACDVLLVPGGGGVWSLLENHDLLGWVRRVHSTTRFTTSVCTGSLLLAAAGLLDGLTAATHWGTAGEIEGYGAFYSPERVVRHDRIITSAGVSSGIDMAFRLAALLADETTAQAIQLYTEYDPQPPFDSGSMAKASPEVLERVGALGLASPEVLERALG
jgi:putative intracellular protease/amidase